MSTRTASMPTHAKRVADAIEEATGCSCTFWPRTSPNEPDHLRIVTGGTGVRDYGAAYVTVNRETGATGVHASMPKKIGEHIAAKMGARARSRDLPVTFRFVAKQAAAHALALALIANAKSGTDKRADRSGPTAQDIESAANLAASILDHTEAYHRAALRDANGEPNPHGNASNDAVMAGSAKRVNALLRPYGLRVEDQDDPRGAPFVVFYDGEKRQPENWPTAGSFRNYTGQPTIPTLSL